MTMPGGDLQTLTTTTPESTTEEAQRRSTSTAPQGLSLGEQHQRRQQAWPSSNAASKFQEDKPRGLHHKQIQERKEPEERQEAKRQRSPKRRSRAAETLQFSGGERQVQRRRKTDRQ
jgi:hypothetical protein